jgi:hypothetical protein
VQAVDLLNADEVAAWLRTPAASVRYWRHQKKGPLSIKVGRQILYRREDVQAWLDDKYSQAVGTQR